MSEHWKACLTQTTARTFEEMCFMIPDPDADPGEAVLPDPVAVQVDFDGPFDGGLVVCVPREVMASIATNMLGEEELPPQDKQADALGEIANIICGNVLPRIAGTKKVFYLAGPRALESPWSADGAEKPAAAEVRVAFDEGPVDVYLFAEVDPADVDLGDPR